jgi:hypothetical protein
VEYRRNFKPVAENESSCTELDSEDFFRNYSNEFSKTKDIKNSDCSIMDIQKKLIAMELAS